MSSYRSDIDDGWADLYRELGVETRPPATTPDPGGPAGAADEEYGLLEGDRPNGGDRSSAVVGEESDLPGDLEAGDDAGDDESEEAGLVEGEPGSDEPQKKRRRRRRRRRKSGPEGAVATVSDSADTPSSHDVPDDASADEGLAPESGRELIANWNVPSWPEIVAGLYRPER